MADDDDKTGLRVIEGDANPELYQAGLRVAWALRELTANLLRVTRGAGKDYEIPGQVIALLQALQEHAQHSRSLPDLRAFLTWDDQIDLDTPRPRLAKHDIICGALQIVASRLVDQRLQERHGENELDDGLRRWNEATAEVRRLRERERRNWPK